MFQSVQFTPVDLKQLSTLYLKSWTQNACLRRCRVWVVTHSLGLSTTLLKHTSCLLVVWAGGWSPSSDFQFGWATWVNCLKSRCLSVSVWHPAALCSCVWHQICHLAFSARLCLSESCYAISCCAVSEIVWIQGLQQIQHTWKKQFKVKLLFWRPKAGFYHKAGPWMMPDSDGYHESEWRDVLIDEVTVSISKIS